MVRDKGPGKTSGRGLEKDIPKPDEEAVAVLVVEEDLSPLDTATDDVVQRARSVYACLSRHVGKVATVKLVGNLTILTTYNHSN